MPPAVLDYRRGYVLGYRACREVLANHGRALAQNNSWALAKGKLDAFDRAYAHGYRDALLGLPAKVTPEQAGLASSSR